MAIVLENGRIRIEIDPVHGRIMRFRHGPLGIELVGEPRLAENFRLLVPLPTWRGHYIIGKQQVLANADVSGDTVRLTWRNLQSGQGHFSIEVTQTVRLDGDDAIFSMEVENHSGHEVEEVFTVALGGMANSEERENWRLHHANMVGKGEEWAFYDAFPGSYLGPAAPVWVAAYPGDLSMPWVDLYDQVGRKGVSISNRDSEARYSALWTQLQPCTTYRGAEGRAQYWPDREVTGETPVGLTLAWNSFPFIPNGVRWSGPPIVFHFHEGTWWEAADHYRAWFDRQWTIDKRGSWMAEADAWQSTIISYPEGTIGYHFRDLPNMARDALKYGIRVLQIDGWDIGGIDRDYPQYTPDPRLGTWEELRGGLSECRAMGVQVMLFSNLQFINIETDWFKEELHRYAVRDPHGSMRNGMGWEYNTTLGLLNQTIHRMVPANPSRPEFQQIVLDQLQNVVRLGAPGTQIDKVHVFTTFDYAPDNPAPREAAYPQGTLDTIGAFAAAAREVDPTFRIASEVHWDRLVPLVDASYSRFFGTDHIPTFGHTFPEYRQSCCVTGDWDFGLVNNCLRFGHIINVEARCLHGTASDAPNLSRYVAEALRTRRALWDVLWHSTVIEAPPVMVDGPPEVLSTLHQSWAGGRKALVLNHFERGELMARIGSLSGAANALLYRPFREPESIKLPASVVVTPDEFVITVFEATGGQDG